MDLDKSLCCGAPLEPLWFARYPVRRFGQMLLLERVTVFLCTRCHYGWPDPLRVQEVRREQGVQGA